MTTPAIIPEIARPSTSKNADGSILPDVIQMREATCQEAINYSDPNPALEQHTLTAFLNTVCGEGSDSRKWTMQDRLFMLF
jgi:hypothetical protein